MISDREADVFVAENFPHFGTNKGREISRLLYEIALRDKCRIGDIIGKAPCQAKEGAHQFRNLKEFLLAERYPSLTKEERQNVLLMALAIDPEDRVIKDEKLTDGNVVPSHLIVEAEAAEENLVRELRQKYPDAAFETTGTYREYIKDKVFTVGDYNKRRETFFIVKAKYDMYCRCPCSSPASDCGYHIMNAGYGCAFDCAYCFLQGYVNGPGIIIPANVEDFFPTLLQYGNDLRLGSGQFSDSLIFDHITGFSTKILDFFRDHPGYIFEFKTKSRNTGLLLKQEAPGNVVVSWSLNPQKIIDEAEWYTASLEQRLKAAGECAKAGYRIGFHFDPIVHYPEWEKDYLNVVDEMFATVPVKQMAWISLGTLRMTPRLKQVMESRFPGISLLNGDLILGFDGKLRYPDALRREIYSKMRRRINDHSGAVPVYLCMEDRSLSDICDTSLMKKCRF
jgi:spore photoproduct lyase